LSAVPLELDPEVRSLEPMPAARASGVPARDAGPPSFQRSLGLGFLVSSGAAAVATTALTIAALSAHADYEEARYERAAADASARYQKLGTAAWIGAGTTLAFGAAGAVLLLTAPKKSPAVGFTIVQTRVGLEPARITVQGEF
jgi:hypothetical protein